MGWGLGETSPERERGSEGAEVERNRWGCSEEGDMPRGQTHQRDDLLYFEVTVGPLREPPLTIAKLAKVELVERYCKVAYRMLYTA